MQIYAFAEVYPSPYKPYHDYQFEQFVAEDFALVVCSFLSHSGELSPAGQRLNLLERTIRLPSVLRDVASALPQLVTKFVTHPLMTLRRFAAGVSAPGRWTHRLVRGARAALVPSAIPDLCIVHNLIAQARLDFLRRVYPGVPVVFYYHGGESFGVPEVSPESAANAFAAADVVFTNTESSRQHAIGRGCAPEKIYVSPVGFNLTDFPDPSERTYRNGGVLNILTVGRLSEEKGVSYALRAMAILKSAGINFRYRIIGDGPEQQRLQAFVAEHRLSDCVQFIGKVPMDQLLAEYASADVMLLPSVVRGTWQENQACVVQEAMLSRSLVAVSRTGGVPESTAPELLRFSFEPEQPEQMAAALKEVAQLSVSELHALGAAARSFAVARYDIRVLNRELLAVTSRVTGRRFDLTDKSRH
jgi:glycosyltransferase involved in cell wall biosynthesis